VLTLAVSLLRDCTKESGSAVTLRDMLCVNLEYELRSMFDSQLHIKTKKIRRKGSF